MVHVAGCPLLQYILEGMRAAGIRDILLVIGYRGEAIREAFGNGSSLGVRLHYAEQPKPKGTGAALQFAEDFAAEEPLLMSYGDILVEPATYQGILRAWRNDLAALIGLNWMEDPCAGAAVYREGDRIVRLVEKPAPGTSTSHWNVAGLSVFGPAIWNALRRIAPSPRGELELTDAVTALIEAGHSVEGYEIQGFWYDVGTPEALAAAERRWQAE